MRIDAYTHFIPEKFFNKIVDSRHPDIGKRVREIPCIHDLDVRKKVVDTFPDYAQILSYPMPPIEILGKGEQINEYAKLINDGFADICGKDPSHFPGWVAEAPIGAPDAGARECERAFFNDTATTEIYTGLRQTPEMIVTAALQEDVDVVGLSILSGAHMTLLPRITAGLRAEGLDDVLVTAGGIIPDDDVPALKAAGVAAIFGPGTTIGAVADFIRANVRSRAGA